MENSKCMKCGCITYEGRHICLTCEGTDDMQTFKRQKMPPKTNRDKLSQVDMQDLLCRMNETMKRKKMMDNHEIRFCIMDVLDEVGDTLCNGVQMSNEKACGECIAAWIYEPKEGRW